jgi:hypothetical protein
MAYRSLDTEMWSDPKFTDDFTPEDKYFWLFLLTTRYGNVSGCFEITYKQIAREMGYSEDSVRNLVYRFSSLHKLITRDDETSEILIHNWYKYNWNKSPLFEKNLNKYVDKIKSKALKNKVLEMYNNFSNGYPIDTLSIPYRYPTDTVYDLDSIDLSLNTKTKDKRFVKPSVEEVKEYCKEKRNNIDGEAFWHFYESKGWKIGKEPMKSWKSAMVTWEKKRKETTPKNEAKQQLEELQEIVRQKSSKMFGGK